MLSWRQTLWTAVLEPPSQGNFSVCAEQRQQRDHDHARMFQCLLRGRKCEDDLGVSGSISCLAGQSRPDLSCQVSQLQQTLPQPTFAQVCGSSMVVRRVHQHADLGLKIRRMLVRNMMLLLHVDASLNTGGLVGSQTGYICGVTDKSLLEGCDAPWSPMAWRLFKMTRTVPSSLGAEAQAMSVALGFVEWATLFLQELISWTI